MVNSFDNDEVYEGYDYPEEDYIDDISPPGEAYQQYVENPTDWTATEAALEMYGIPDPRLIMDD